MNDLTLQQVVLRICAGLLIVSIHGGVLSAASWILGDTGPSNDGRLGLNPLHHLDLLGGLLFVFFTYGWIRPIAIDPDQLRRGRAALVLSVIVAIFVTIGTAELLQLTRPFILTLLPDTAAETFFIFVETFGQLSLSFALFNLVPLPPLTGQHLLVAAFPQWRDSIRRTQPFFAVAFALLIVSGSADRLLGPAELVARHLILGR